MFEWFDVSTVKNQCVINKSDLSEKAYIIKIILCVSKLIALNNKDCHNNYPVAGKMFKKPTRS